MFLNKKTLACTALILVSSCLLAVGGGRGYPNAGCPNGPDGHCIPQRITYGYYPTTWRRWPTDTRAATRPEPEVLPTPAKEPPPKSESETPSKTPSETPIQIPSEAPIQIPSEPSSQIPSETPREVPSLPTEKEPATTEPGAELPLPLPSDDGPPAPPRAPKINAKELAPPEDSPAPPAQSEALPDAPKTLIPKPDDDPFQDEPAKENDAPAAKPAKPRSGRSRSEHRLGQQEPIRWRVTAKTQTLVDQSVPLTPAYLGEEPQRLPSIERGGDGDPSPLPVNLTKSNPFRSPISKPRADRVLPTASWSAEPRETDAPTGAFAKFFWVQLTTPPPSVLCRPLLYFTGG